MYDIVRLIPPYPTGLKRTISAIFISPFTVLLAMILVIYLGQGLGLIVVVIIFVLLSVAMGIHIGEMLGSQKVYAILFCSICLVFGSAYMVIWILKTYGKVY